ALVEGDTTTDSKSTLISLDLKKNEGSVSDDDPSNAIGFKRVPSKVTIDGKDYDDYAYSAGGSHTPSFITLPNFNTNAFTGVACAGGFISSGSTNGTINGLGRGIGVLTTPLA